MMNKQKTSKAWRWKVATFLPLLALLLMAFGNRSEKVPPEQNLFSSEILTDQQDSLKRWTEADFKSIAGKENEKLFFDGKKFANILMNKESRIMIGGILYQMTDVPDRIRRFRDFNLAEDKSSFSKVSINGKERMVSAMPIIVRRDIATNTEDYQKLLNTIGNTILEIRGKYANEIFGKSYQKLDMNQRNEIDKLVPFDAFISAPKQIAPPPPPPALFIDIRKDGNYLDNKLYSIEEIGKKAELLQKKYPDVMARLKVESDVPMSRVTEIKEVLRNSKVLHVNYSTANAGTGKLLPPPPPKPQIIIEIREDGNFINDKLYTLEGITEKLKALSIKNQDKVYYLVDDPMPQNRIDEVKAAVNKVTDNFKKLTPPPPPPPNVNDMGFRITIIKDAYSVNRKSCTLSEIEKMLEIIDPKKEFVQIDTHSTSSKELQSSLKEMLEKKGITYQTSWTK